MLTFAKQIYTSSMSKQLRSIIIIKSRGSSVSIVTKLRDVLPGLNYRQGYGRILFLFSTASRPALGPTHPPVQWVPRALSWGVKWPEGVKLTTHLHLLPKLRMCGATPALLQYVFMAWCLIKQGIRLVILKVYVGNIDNLH